MVWGGRLSLTIGFGSAFLMTFIATIIGMIAGYFRGAVDDVLNFLMNLFLVIPGLPLLVLLSAYLKPGTTTIIFALAITGWAFNGRIIRAQTLSLREKDFVAAAVVSGEPAWSVIFVHILPNMVNILVGGFIGAVIYGIMASTGLAFLGPREYARCDVGYEPVLGAERRGADDRRVVGVRPVRAGGRAGRVRVGVDQLRHGRDHQPPFERGAKSQQDFTKSTNSSDACDPGGAP